MLCPTCEAELACAKCRNFVTDPVPDAVSSTTPLRDMDGNLAFEQEEDDDDDDESVAVAIGYDEDTGLVIINFAKETSWLALSPDNTEDLANVMLANAKEARKSQAT